MQPLFLAILLSVQASDPLIAGNLQPQGVNESPREVVNEAPVVSNQILSAPAPTYLLLPLPAGSTSIPLGYSRPIRESREIWNYYAPDQSGRFRPRVIFLPEGAFEMPSGMPYHWTTARPNDYRR